MKRVSVFILLIVFFASSCYKLEKNLTNTLTLYNLTDATSIKISFKSNVENFANIDSKSSDGVKIDGTIMLKGKPTRSQEYNFPDKYDKTLFDSIQERILTDSSSSQYKGDPGKSLPELFGFSDNYPAAPQGFATIRVGVDKVIDIVFYHLDYNRYFGSGIGIDNNKNLYKVYLVTEVY